MDPLTSRPIRRACGRAARRLLLATACAALWPADPLDAQSELIDREYEIKAAYLYNFGKYVAWPVETHAAVGDSSDFVIGVVGDDPFGGSIDELARTKRLDGRRIVVRRILSPDDWQPCHLLFVPETTAESLVAGVLEQARSAPTLVVGERPGFAESSGALNFYVEQNRVRFEINPEAAENSGLRISSKLLQLGRIVGDPSKAISGVDR